ncbi:glycosyltransferase family 2 protein [Bremerella cremea]|uniref:Glycosyl transferase n=1 Tax=Blastopirellula marina TaxID=124 RepID=A0A2S8FL15_9BACT|nr:glycosyl transferase [Blastopirellula marina]RCS45914.1 glycosyltransferase family 2 protein [Bremerella cremea]
MSSVKNISVVIPAYNEANVIRRCLNSLVNSSKNSRVQIVVVANGCSDETANRAREFGPDVKVIETEIGSKIHALNLGDEAAEGFPRFYIDADIEFEEGTLDKLSEELERPGVLAVAPRMLVNCNDRPWIVRAYYDVWLQMPYCQSGMIGSGVYGMSEEGRQRFGEFPKITADDGYVRLLFSPSERKTVESCSFAITPPKSLEKIVDINTRSHFGNAELKKLYPELWTSDEGSHGLSLMKLAINPLWWPSLAVYIYVKLAVRRRVRERFRRGEIDKWERDETSREEPAS